MSCDAPIDDGGYSSKQDPERGAHTHWQYQSQTDLTTEGRWKTVVGSDSVNGCRWRLFHTGVDADEAREKTPAMHSRINSKCNLTIPVRMPKGPHDGRLFVIPELAGTIE